MSNTNVGDLYVLQVCIKIPQGVYHYPNFIDSEIETLGLSNPTRSPRSSEAEQTSEPL